MNPTEHPLPYDPASLPRETKRHYISASDNDIREMLATLGMATLEDLYAHIPKECRFNSPPDLPEEVSYEALQDRMISLSRENAVKSSFLGDGLPVYQVSPVVAKVAGIRNLSTAYTPYQPERSQGTLATHWIYQCLMSQLTGFEAINSSLYDRSTAIYEAIASSVRMARKAETVLVSEGIYPGDREVLETLLPGTGIHIEYIPLHPHHGRTDTDILRSALLRLGQEAAGVVFPQVNCLGLLEDVDALTDMVGASPARSIAVIDPMLLGTGGLKPPSAFGNSGVDMIVGEAQHLAIGPNFGGPGLGLFGVRHNATDKNAIRQTPGRYVGKARDESGRECLVMVLSTREQHIRKDKATSNICSNQAFLATLAGAALLSRGEAGMQAAFAEGHRKALEAAKALCRFKGIELAFPETPFVNEVVFSIEGSVPALIEAARIKGIHLGVDISGRLPGDERQLLKVSFSDMPADLEALESFIREAGFTPGTAAPATLSPLSKHHLRTGKLALPSMEDAAIVAYYERLGEQNVSPDDACYPLGSCTMKYNPHINDWAAGLPGFTDVHPQAPLEDVQGCLHLLHEIQEWFTRITGLAAITTQPVAGAQGELVGIKMFQAYHADRGESHRDVILIPSSAHGTNFATAVMAGYTSRKAKERVSGIVLLESNADGTIDFEDFERKVAEHREHLAGVMITNPNTCGIFESRFREIADRVHEAGGLVYMDGANMNAIAGWCDLGAMGVDAVHNNLHKTWTIPHGGGGPGDAFVGVSERLAPYLPGFQIEKTDQGYRPVRAPKSIGSFHRHWGNFAHKVRAYTYLLRLGREGVRRMTAVAVLSARYCFERLRTAYPTLPAGAATPRMHEFILTLAPEDFVRIEKAGVPGALAITRFGKLFLDFGFHAPTVAWPETFGLMIEPTESYSKAELDRFCEAVLTMLEFVRERPDVLVHVPVFTPVDRVNEVEANRQVTLFESLHTLPEPHPSRLKAKEIGNLPISEICQRIRDCLPTPSASLEA